MSKTIAVVFGWVFLAIGVLGFFGNPIVGLNGFFLADTTHNIVHLLSGVIFLWVAYSASSKSGVLLKVFGIVYLLVAILGFMATSGTGMGSILGLIATNTADNWLHVVLAIVFLYGGFMGSKSSAPVSMGPQM